MRLPSAKHAAILKAGETLRSATAARTDSPLSRRLVDSNYLRVSQAASLASMSAAVLRKWIREGRVPAFRFGRAGYRVRLCDILRPIEPPAPKGDRRHAG